MLARCSTSVLLRSEMAQAHGMPEYTVLAVCTLIVRSNNTTLQCDTIIVSDTLIGSQLTSLPIIDIVPHRQLAKTCTYCNKSLNWNETADD